MQALAVQRNIQAVDDVADDFTERQRDDRQIVAAQAQHRNTDDHARDTGRRAAGQNRQQQAERFVRHAHALAQPHGHYNAGERADAHKARVAEAQLAGNADRQVEGDGHDDIRADRHELTLERAGHRAGGDHHLTGDERRDHNAEGYQGAAEFFASHGFHLTLSRARACPAGRSA